MTYEPEMPKHGGFKKLKSFRTAQLLHDFTVVFCDEHTEPRSRSRDQMLRAARAITRQIAEGSQLGGTSKKLEIRQTAIARASLDELRLAYEGFLQQRGLPVWPADDPRRVDFVALRPRTVDEVVTWATSSCTPAGALAADEAGSAAPPASPEAMANCALTLISMAFTLIDRQMKAQNITLRREESQSRRTPRQSSLDLDGLV